MSKIKTYDSIMSGLHDHNIRFADLRNLLLALGFRERIKGDHYIYKKPDTLERIVIQPVGNKAKPYQVKQVRNLFLKYNVEVR